MFEDREKALWRLQRELLAEEEEWPEEEDWEEEDWEEEWLEEDPEFPDPEDIPEEDLENCFEGSYEEEYGSAAFAPGTGTRYSRGSRKRFDRDDDWFQEEDPEDGEVLYRSDYRSGLKKKKKQKRLEKKKRKQEKKRRKKERKNSRKGRGLLILVILETIIIAAFALWWLSWML